MLLARDAESADHASCSASFVTGFDVGVRNLGQHIQHDQYEFQHHCSQTLDRKESLGSGVGSTSLQFPVPRCKWSVCVVWCEDQMHPGRENEFVLNASFSAKKTIRRLYVVQSAKSLKKRTKEPLSDATSSTDLLPPNIELETEKVARRETASLRTSKLGGNQTRPKILHVHLIQLEAGEFGTERSTEVLNLLHHFELGIPSVASFRATVSRISQNMNSCGLHIATTRAHTLPTVFGTRAMAKVRCGNGTCPSGSTPFSPVKSENTGSTRQPNGPSCPRSGYSLCDERNVHFVWTFVF